MRKKACALAAAVLAGMMAFAGCGETLMQQGMYKPYSMRDSRGIYGGVQNHGYIRI